jgi:hypothetical protein
MSERTMRQRVVRLLRDELLDPISVENRVGPGTPDINCTLGWLELKQADRWPPRGGALRLPHLTAQQRAWLKRRREHGGCAWLLLQVGTEWMLFDGADVLAVGQEDREGLRSVAIAVWDRGISHTLASVLADSAREMRGLR